MKKNIVPVLILVMIAGYAFAKENLAILPFTGGQGNERETIAELFSFDRRLIEVFDLIPRTSMTEAINSEQRFQMSSGMTDADAIVAIGRQLGARYVLAGSITSIGNNNLLVISIMDILNLQQIAGDYQTYPRDRIQDIRDKLPAMVANIIEATRENTDSLPELAVVPVLLEDGADGADQRVADALAQVLAVHLIRSRKYAVFPRTQSLAQVTEEHKTQMSGNTADEHIIGVGHGRNPDMVLSVAARRLGSDTMFNAAIINLSTGAQIFGHSVDYQDINDGMIAMEILSLYLAGAGEQAVLRQQEIENQRSEAERQRLREEERRLREEERRLSAEEREKNRRERVQRRKRSQDTFLRNSGAVLGFRGGWNSTHESIPLAAAAELKLGTFSAQAEIQYTVQGYRYSFNDIGYRYDLIQIPLLAKATFGDFNASISPFAGIALNFPIAVGSDYDEDYYGQRTDVTSLSLPFSGIVGANVTLGFLFGDIRYAFDLGERVLNGDIKDAQWRGTFEISGGIKVVIPFKKK